MVLKQIQIYGVHISRKRICKLKKKLKVDLFTTPGNLSSVSIITL